RPPRRRMTTRARSCAASGSRSRSLEGTSSGEEVARSQGLAAGEVQDAQLPAVQPLRPPPGDVPQVRHVPHLPARARPSGRDPGHDEVELVTEVRPDPIADMLTRIRNANKAMHESAVMPTSKLKVDIARLLKEEGYITGYRIQKGADQKGKDGTPAPLGYDLLVIDLKYGRNRERVISNLKRVSRP